MKNWRKIAGSKAVQDRVNAVARQSAARVAALNAAEGNGARVTVESGVRPGGRAYANVVMSMDDKKPGESTPRRVLLRRGVMGY